MRAFSQWSAASLVLVAAILAALIPESARQEVWKFSNSLDFRLNLTILGLLLMMILLTRFLAISWRGVPAGIALGFGIVAATQVATSPLMSHFGSGVYIKSDLTEMIAFHLCALVWLVYVLLPEKSPRASGVQISELEVHLQELQRMTRH